MEMVEMFLNDWNSDDLEMKPIFKALYRELADADGVRLEWIERPGISYSLRAAHENQTDRPLFVMMDVIDDDPKERWLSVCFYEDMISDPDEMGDLIPEGLLGSDGYCFDISEADDDQREYVAERIREACESAGKS